MSRLRSRNGGDIEADALARHGEAQIEAAAPPDVGRLRQALAAVERQGVEVARQRVAGRDEAENVAGRKAEAVREVQRKSAFEAGRAGDVERPLLARRRPREGEVERAAAPGSKLPVIVTGKASLGAPPFLRRRRRRRCRRATCFLPRKSAAVADRDRPLVGEGRGFFRSSRSPRMPGAPSSRSKSRGINVINYSNNCEQP